jgi:hypothetical protein
MNELYNETIERRGKTYHYDPDMDCYYSRSNESTVSKYAWIVLTAILAIAAFCIEYRAGLV